MSELNGIIGALYSRLLLRDFFGKVVPGTIVLISISVISFSPDNVRRFILELSFFPSLIMVGLAWIVAFAIQAIGEETRLIRYHNHKSNKEFYTNRYNFHKKTNDNEYQQLERLVVIKEACGNGYLALGLSSALLSLNVLVLGGCQAFISGFRAHWPVIVVVGVLIMFLARMHFIHVRRQDEYMDTILDTVKKNDKPSVT